VTHDQGKGVPGNRDRAPADAGDGPRAVSIVIHYGAAADTLACVEGLLRQQAIAHTVQVIDNGTGDAAIAALAGRPGLALLRNTGNEGFAPAANQGIALARAQGARWAWLVNNDTTLADDRMLRTLIDFARQHGHALVSPMINNRTRTGSRLRGLSFYYPGLALTRASASTRPAVPRRSPRRIPFLSGTALLVDLHRVSGPLFDPAFFAYYEDVDLALRLPPETLAVAPGVRIDHAVSRATGGSLRKHQLKARNLVYLARKHAQAGGRFRLHYWLLFVPLEARKYTRTPRAFLHATRTAWREGWSMPLR